MPPLELLPVAFIHFMLDEAGSTWIECVLLAALLASVCTLLVLAAHKYS